MTCCDRLRKPDKYGRRKVRILGWGHFAPNNKPYVTHFTRFIMSQGVSAQEQRVMAPTALYTDLL